jgi:hypothetical protein
MRRTTGPMRSPLTRSGLETVREWVRDLKRASLSSQRANLVGYRSEVTSHHPFAKPQCSVVPFVGLNYIFCAISSCRHSQARDFNSNDPSDMWRSRGRTSIHIATYQFVCETSNESLQAYRLTMSPRCLRKPGGRAARNKMMCVTVLVKRNVKPNLITVHP